MSATVYKSSYVNSRELRQAILKLQADPEHPDVRETVGTAILKIARALTRIMVCPSRFDPEEAAGHAILYAWRRLSVYNGSTDAFAFVTGCLKYGILDSLKRQGRWQKRHTQTPIEHEPSK